MPPLPGYRRIERIHQRGVLADLPAIADVVEGTIYFATDTEQLFRSNGAAWQQYGPTPASGFAPDGAQYAVAAAHAGLSAERVLTDTASITWDFGTAAQAKANIVNAAIVALGLATEQTTTSTGTQNDFSLSARNTLLRCNNASLLTITGFTIGGNAPQAGDTVRVVNVGASQIDFSNQTGSTAANRLINIATGTVSLAAGGSITYVYDDTTDRWRCVEHEQGAAIVPTFDAGRFTGNGSMTWTVASGDVVTESYHLRGRIMTVVVDLSTTTVGGTPSTTLVYTIPNGLTIARTQRTPYINTDNGTAGVGVMAAVVATSTITFRPTAALSGNWAASTDNTSVRGLVVFEVQ